VCDAEKSREGEERRREGEERAAAYRLRWSMAMVMTPTLGT
jgi:hypothetical protein